MMMRFVEILLIGISLSMDALAVSVALGARGRKLFDFRKMLLTALLFGGFQALMPFLGWVGGSACGSYATVWGKYIASGLLFIIGGKMVWDAVKGEEEKLGAFGLLMLTGLAFATSIDALLVGVGFACMGQKSIGLDISIIGCTTFLISLAGCLAGPGIGKLFGKHCETAGGITLILIGLKVLIFG